MSGYCYDGNRTKPENLGWRFKQTFGSPPLDLIETGKLDGQLSAIFHEAADSEYYYRYEKDWGEF